MKDVNQASTGTCSPNINGDGNHVSFHLPANKLGNEVLTILKVIESIRVSREQNQSSDDVDFTRNLDLKLKRFEAYRSQLESDYKELALLYGFDYESAKKSTGMDEFDFEECHIELRRLSKDALEKSNDDPLKALQGLVDYFCEQFASSDTESNFSKGAIRYFLLKELVICNVFPNLDK